jgi:hypothetical protein
MAENFDFTAGYTPTTSISAAQLLQMVNSMRPNADRGGVIFTTDLSLSSSPDVTGDNAKYKRYLWCDKLSATGKIEVRTYNAVTPGWELLGYTDNSITTAMLQDLCVTVDKISSVVNSNNRAAGDYIVADGAGGAEWAVPPAELDDDARSMVYGQEYLGAFWNSVRVPRGVTPYGPQIVFSGDSTTVGSSTWGFIWDTFRYILQARLPNFQVCYNSQGTGKDINWWRTDPDGLAKDIVGGHLTADGTTPTTAGGVKPDLLVLRWGLNVYSSDPDIFATELNTALAQIRNSGGGNYNRPITDLSIILMSPNIADDTANGRDATYLLAINEKIRAAARTYKCCFIDTTRIWPKAYQDETNVMELDAGNYHVHPLKAFTEAIASKIAEVALPESLNIYGASKFKNTGYSTLAKTPASAATDYTKGISLLRATTGDSWPLDGTTLTLRQHDDGGTIQKHFKNGSNRQMTRMANGAAWMPWSEDSILFDTHANSSITAATLPDSLPIGISFYEALTAESWPNSAGGTYAASVMCVRHITTNHCYQMLVSNYGETYVRFKTGGANTWTDWQYNDPYRVAASIAVGAGAGTGGTAAISGDNVCGTITIETGTTCPVTSVVATINLVYAYPSNRIKVMLAPASSAACTSGYVFVNVVSSSSFTLVSSTPTALTDSQTGAAAYVWNYHVSYKP